MIMRNLLSKTGRNLSFGNIMRAVRNPWRIERFADGLRADFRKGRMSMDIERRELPERLASVFDEKEKVIREFHREIENNDSFYKEFNIKKKGTEKCKCSLRHYFHP